MKIFNFVDRKEVAYRAVLSLLLAIICIGVNAQNPALEMAAGDGNPTGNGPVLTTTIQFRKNTDNPTGTTFTTYNSPSALTVTATLSNQQYDLSALATPAGTAFFGYTGVASPIFPLMTAFGSPVDANFTSTGATAGAGMTVASNSVIELVVASNPLRAAGRATNGRWQMVDMTFTFNRPVNNPILHIAGLGAGVSTGLELTSEFDFVSANVPVSFSKLSGTSNFIVNTTQILNNAAVPAVSGAGVGTGSVLIAGTGITTITLRTYLRGNENSLQWAADGTGASPAGDSFTMGFSVAESDLAVTKTVNNSKPVPGSNVTFTLTAKNNGASNNTGVKVNDLLPSGYTYVSSSTATGTYDSGTGVWNIGNLADGASATLTITAKVNSSGFYANIATISSSGGIIDPLSNNNQASASVSPDMDTDGDGIPDSVDLDDDNDGIPDLAENTCSSPINKTIFFQGFETGGYTGDLGNGVIMQSADVALYDQKNGTGGQIGSAMNNGTDLPCDNGEEQCEGSITSYPFNFSCGGAANQTITGNKGFFFNSCSTEANKDYNNNGVTGEVFKFVNIPLQAGFTYDFGFKLTNIYSTSGNYTFSARLLNSSNSLVSTTNINVDATSVGNIITSSGAITVPTSGLYSIVFVGPTTADGADFLLDDIKLTQRLCDEDGDGIPNILDLDSDGDGCYDAIEGDENVLPSQLNANGSINITTTGGVDGNGVPKLVNSGGSADIGSDQGQGIGTSQNASVKETATITTQPLASQAVNHTAASTNLTVAASGSPSLTYQWYSNTSNSTTGGTAISGATTNTYTPSTTTVGTQYYYVEVTGSCGSAKSNVSTVIVQPRTNLSVTKLANPSNPLVGTNVTFTITATNAGPSDATGVVVTDLLPSGYTYVTGTATKGSYINSTGVWNIGTLNDQESATLQVTAIINASGVYTNAATINGDFNDADKTNNIALSTVVPQSDTDGDGIGDDTDLDDDNDGILDTDENTCSWVQLEYSHNSSSGQGQEITFPDGSSSAAFTNADNLSFGTGLDEATDNSAYHYLIRGANESTYSAAKTNNDYLQVGFQPTQNILLNRVRFGYSITNDAQNNFEAGNFKVAVEYSTSPTFTTSTLLFQDMQIGNLYGVGYSLYDFKAPSQVLNNGTKYYFRFYLYSKNNLDALGRVSIDDIYIDGQPLTTTCDVDGDMIPNLRDLDSDGDGCLDAIEGDENILPSQLTAQRISGTVDANGVPRLVNSSGAADIGGDQGQGVGTSQNASVKETATITTQPLASQAVNHTAASTNLTVAASGSPSLTYQWYSNTSNSNTGGTAISGATTNTYTPSTTTVGTQYYYVEVTGSCGSAKSDVSTVIVQPRTNLSVTKLVDKSNPLVGTDVIFTITATNGGPSAASGVIVSDVLSSTGYTYKNSSATVGSYNSSTGVWTIGALASSGAAATATLTITATVK